MSQDLLHRPAIETRDRQVSAFAPEEPFQVFRQSTSGDVGHGLGTNPGQP